MVNVLDSLMGRLFYGILTIYTVYRIAQPVDACNDDRPKRSSTTPIVCSTAACGQQGGPPYAHKSPCVRFEIDAARKHRKPIIAVHPNGQLGQPMPKVVNEGLYRAIGWRGNALEKAILGEYPPDARVFDVADDVDRRSVVQWTLGASAGVALLIAGATHDRVEQLPRELTVSGAIVPPLNRGPFVIPWMIGGAMTGLLVDAWLGA
jgi:hypothetical protein